MAEQKDEHKELEVLKKIVCSCYPMEIYDGEIMMNDTFFTLEKDRDRYLYLAKLIKEREEGLFSRKGKTKNGRTEREDS